MTKSVSPTPKRAQHVRQRAERRRGGFRLFRDTDSQGVTFNASAWYHRAEINENASSASKIIARVQKLGDLWSAARC